MIAIEFNGGILIVTDARMCFPSSAHTETMGEVDKFRIRRKHTIVFYEIPNQNILKYMQ